MPRSNASGERTVWLHQDETRLLTFQLPSAARYGLAAPYSNDNNNYLPLEQVELKVDGQVVPRLNAEDTGDSGHGWNESRWAGEIAAVPLAAGSHRIEVTPRAEATTSAWRSTSSA